MVFVKGGHLGILQEDLEHGAGEEEGYISLMDLLLP